MLADQTTLVNKLCNAELVDPTLIGPFRTSSRGRVARKIQHARAHLRNQLYTNYSLHSDNVGAAIDTRSDSDSASVTSSSVAASDNHTRKLDLPHDWTRRDVSTALDVMAELAMHFEHGSWRLAENVSRLVNQSVYLFVGNAHVALIDGFGLYELQSESRKRTAAYLEPEEEVVEERKRLHARIRRLEAQQ